jgi:hypothetical protein
VEINNIASGNVEYADNTVKQGQNARSVWGGWKAHLQVTILKIKLQQGSILIMLSRYFNNFTLLTN